MLDDCSIGVVLGHGRVILSLSGEVLFDGDAMELVEVLRQHRRQVEYIDSRDGDGNERPSDE